jgi:hypothetical protein
MRTESVDVVDRRCCFAGSFFRPVDLAGAGDTGPAVGPEGVVALPALRDRRRLPSPEEDAPCALFFAPGSPDRFDLPVEEDSGNRLVRRDHATQS